MHIAPLRTTCFPPATLISTLRIFKEQAALQPQTSTHPISLLADSRGAQVCNPGIQDQGGWWRMTGSNRRPPACKAGALPAELIPQAFGPQVGLAIKLVGLVGFEPTTPALSRRCSNRLSYRPNCLHSCSLLNQQPISVGA